MIRKLHGGDLALLQTFIEKSKSIGRGPPQDWLENALASDLCCLAATIVDGEMESLCVGCSFEFYLKMRAPSCWVFAWSQNLPNTSVPLEARKLMADIVENHFNSLGMNTFYAVIDWSEIKSPERHIKAFAKLNNISTYSASLFSIVEEAPTESSMAIEKWLATPVRKFPVAIIRMQK